MLSEIFLNSRNEAHLARVSIFVHLVTDHIFIYPFILYRLFYFISFYFIYYLLSTIRIFFITFFFIYFVIICPVPGCSGMFQDVPECSMFWVLLTPPNFFGSVNNAAVHINAANVKCLTTYKKKGGTKGIKINGVRHHNLEGDMILYLAVHLIKFQNCSAFFFFGSFKDFFLA